MLMQQCNTHVKLLRYSDDGGGGAAAANFIDGMFVW